MKMGEEESGASKGDVAGQSSSEVMSGNGKEYVLRLILLSHAATALLTFDIHLSLFDCRNARANG